MAVVLCFASLCDQLQNALSISRFQLLDDNRPSHKNWSERKITIKMPGTHPLEVNRLSILNIIRVHLQTLRMYSAVSS